MMFILPEHLLKCLLQEWLEIRFVARLDSACCVVGSREELTTLLAELVVTKIEPKIPSTLQWMIYRNIQTKCMIIRDDFKGSDAELLVKFIQHTAENVTAISLPNRSKSGIYLNEIKRTCRNLTRLECGSVNALFLSQVVHFNRNLEHLDVRVEEGSADDCAGLELPSLTSLCVSTSASSDSQVAYALIEAAPNLQRLSTQGFEQPPTSAAFKKSCRHVRSVAFNLDGWPNVDVSVMNITKMFGSVLNLEIISGCALSDHHVELLAQNLPYLRTINLSRCRLITDASLKHIAHHCGNRLKFIRLSCNPSITRAGLDYLRAACAADCRVHCVEFSLCAEHFETIAHECKATHVVIMDCLYDVFDSATRGRVKSCDSILELHLCRAGQWVLSPSELTFVFMQCPNLRTVILGGKTAEMIDKLRSYSPDITFALNGEVNDYDVMKLPI